MLPRRIEESRGASRAVWAVSHIRRGVSFARSRSRARVRRHLGRRTRGYIARLDSFLRRAARVRREKKLCARAVAPLPGSERARRRERFALRASGGEPSSRQQASKPASQPTLRLTLSDRLHALLSASLPSSSLPPPSLSFCSFFPLRHLSNSPSQFHFFSCLLTRSIEAFSSAASPREPWL